MSSANALMEKILAGRRDGSSDDDVDAPPSWSPSRSEPSSAYVRRAKAFAERMRRAVESEDGDVGEFEFTDVDVGADARAGGDFVGNLNAAFGAAAASDAATEALMEELRGNLREGDPLVKRASARRERASPSAARSPGRGVSGRAARALGATREHVDALGAELARERKAHAMTRKKYEELGAHASVVLRQRDDARASLEASSSRERAANARVDELSRRLDEERAMSDTRLEEVRASSSKWREAQNAELNALREAAEARMREANEAAERVEERIAARVAHYEKRLSEADRDAAKRARDAIGRFGALASSSEVQAHREISALKARIEELEAAALTANRERANAQHEASSTKRELDEIMAQIDSSRLELANSRDVIHARDEALASVRRELRSVENARDEAHSRASRLDAENKDLAIKVSSLEQVIGDVGGHKRAIMILRARVAHLTSELGQAKEVASTTKDTVKRDIATLRDTCLRDTREALERTTEYYEARLRESSEERMIELRVQLKRLEDEMAAMKKTHARELREAIDAERNAAASASESSIRSSTQRSIEAEKAKAVAEMSARDARARVEALTKEKEATEEALRAANEHIGELRAESAALKEKLKSVRDELEKSESNVRDLGRLINTQTPSSDEENEGKDRVQLESTELASAVEALKQKLEEARTETAAAVKRAEETAQLEIDALKRGMEMSAHRASSESEARIAALERELAVALQTKKVAFEEVQELRTQIERYEALTKLQDEAMSTSKTQVKSLSQRLRSLETSVSGSPTPTSPSASPGSANRSRSVFITPGTFSSLTPGSPVARPAPSPITVPRSPRSPRASTSRSIGLSPMKSPLFRGLDDSDDSS